MVPYPSSGMVVLLMLCNTRDRYVGSRQYGTIHTPETNVPSESCRSLVDRVRRRGGVCFHLHTYTHKSQWRWTTQESRVA